MAKKKAPHKITEIEALKHRVEFLEMEMREVREILERPLLRREEARSNKQKVQKLRKIGKKKK